MHLLFHKCHNLVSRSLVHIKSKFTISDNKKNFTNFMSIFPKPNKAVNSTSLNPNTNVKPFTYLKYFTENR